MEQLLKILEDNARMSVEDIAAMLNKSPAEVAAMIDLARAHFPIYADRIIHHVRIWTRRWKTAHRPDYGRLGNLCKNSPRRNTFR